MDIIESIAAFKHLPVKDVVVKVFCSLGSTSARRSATPDPTTDRADLALLCRTHVFFFFCRGRSTTNPVIHSHVNRQPSLARVSNFSKLVCLALSYQERSRRHLDTYTVRGSIYY